MLVYGTYKMQNASVQEALYGGPGTEASDGYPGVEFSDQSMTTYYGYSRSAVEIGAFDYISNSGASATSFLMFVDCNDVNNQLLKNTTLSKGNAPAEFKAFLTAFSNEDYRFIYLQRNCYVGKSGLVALGVLTGLVGLFLIPASLCSAFCVSRKCNRTLNMWVAAMLTAAALALSIVCIWAITQYGASHPTLSKAIWCKDIDEAAYYESSNGQYNLGASRSPPPGASTAAYWNVPAGCYTDIAGENEDNFLENVAKNWAVGIAGAILILLTSLLLMGFLGCIAQSEVEDGLRKGAFAQQYPIQHVGPINGL